MLKQLILDELDDHLNNGCVDSRCDIPPDGIFRSPILEHLAEILVDVLEEEEVE